MNRYYVYILSSPTGTLYTGMTNNLERRVYQHKHKLIQGFTTRYDVDRPVYFEETADVLTAITREKQIKGWSRVKKVVLVETLNPTWADLSDGWYGT